MSDNYSVDDILAEIAKKRDSDSDEPRSYSSTPSVTEIIGGDALDAMMKSADAHKRSSEIEDTQSDLAPVKPAEEKRDPRREAQLLKEEQRRKKAEEKRLAEERRAEEKRLAEEKRAEERKLA